MERNTVTLETAKKLKAARFPQKSHSWYDPKDGRLWFTGEWIGHETPSVFKATSSDIAAPTAQEIADQLDFNSYEHMFAAADNYDGKKRPMAEALAALWLEGEEARK